MWKVARPFTMVITSSISVNNQLLEKTTQNTVTGLSQCEGNIKFEDVSEKVEQCLPLSQAWRPLLDPFPSQTPDKYLSKEYKIDSFQIDDTWVSGTNRTWFFPYVLFQIPQIADVIKHYRYFRSDVQLDLRVASSVYHQGLGQLSFIPLQQGSPSPNIPAINPIYRWSACQPVDLSFSSQQSASLCVPYLNPLPYIDLQQPLAADQGLIGCFIYSQITPYRTISDVGPFQVSVWAKFINPIVAAPIVAAPKIPKHQSSETSSGSIGVRPESTNTRRYVDPEALIKTTSSALVAGINNSPLSPLIKTVGKGVELAEGLVDSFSSFFGLFDKPTSVAASSPMLPQWGRDFTMTSGIDSAMRIGQHPTTKLATTAIFPMETSHIKITNLAQIPMLHHIDYFNSTRSTFSLELAPVAPSSSCYTNLTRDYLRYTAAAFHQWRGSIKYRVKFVCGQFVKARVQISIRFNSGVDTTGQIFTRVIEVNGETETLFTIPFLRNRYWSVYGEGNSFLDDLPILQFTLIDQVVGGTVSDDPTVDVVIWRAGGEDIQFAGLRRGNIPAAQAPTSTKIPEQQTSVRKVFSKKFDSLVCDCTQAMEMGYCTDDMSTTVADAMKRYSKMPVTSDYSNYQYWFSEPNNGVLNGPIVSVASEPFWYFKHLFWFERGDLRFRFISTKENAQGKISAQLLTDFQTTSNSANGTVYTYIQHNPELQLELPYISPFPYLPIAGLMALQHSFNWSTFGETRSNFAVLSSQTTTEDYIAASDNYVCGMLAPPPYCDGTTLNNTSIKKRTKLKS